MSKLIFEIFFNIIVNIYQGFIIMWFLVQCLKYKEKYEKKQVYAVGITAIFVYLEMQIYITNFEGGGVLLLMVLTILLSAIFFQGTLIRKLLYNVILITVAVFTATLVGSIIGLANKTGYIQLVSENSFPKYISMLLNQIVLWLALYFAVKLVRRNYMGFNSCYTIMVISAFVISIFSVVALQRLVEEEGRYYRPIYACMVVAGGILLLMVSFIMYWSNEKNHVIQQQQEMRIRTYRQQKHDIEEIVRNYKEMEKIRHEINKIIVTTSVLLQDKKYQEAEKFLEQFKEKESHVKRIYYIDNIVLNSLLNQKIEYCQENDIIIKCISGGKVDGIKDIDLHCIVSNLLDNAIEATQKLDNKDVDLQRNIHFSIFANEYSIYIEVTNAVEDEVLRLNPKFQSSKEGGNHGYGITNVKESVEKYHGKIRYRQKLSGYLTCEVVLLKEFTTEMGNSRQAY